MLAEQTDRRYTKAAAMRVYLPLTLTALEEVYKAGELGPAGEIRAFAVTPALHEWYVSGDAEELEYAALGGAAADSLRLLSDAPEAPRRRVVVAADAQDGAVQAAPEDATGAGTPGEVRVTGPLPLSVVAAVHVDADLAAGDVAAAAEALDAAGRGDEDAQLAVDAAEDHELLWYATQEIPHLLGR